MTGPASQQWGEEVTHTFPLPEVPGPFNFVNSEGLAYEAAEASRAARATFSAVDCRRVALLMLSAGGASAAAQPASATIRSIVRFDYSLFAAMTVI